MSAPLVVWAWGVEVWPPHLHIARAACSGAAYQAPALCGAELAEQAMVTSANDLRARGVTNPHLCPLCQVEFVMLLSTRLP